MKMVLFVFAAFVSLVLEAKLTVLGIRPNLTVLLAFYIGLRGGPASGLLSGVTLGLLKDGLAGGVLGPSALSHAIAGYAASYMSGILGWKPVLGFIVIPVVTVLEGFFSFAFLRAVAEAPGTVGNIAAAVALQGALSVLAAPFIRARDGK